MDLRKYTMLLERSTSKRVKFTRKQALRLRLLNYEVSIACMKQDTIQNLTTQNPVSHSCATLYGYHDLPLNARRNTSVCSIDTASRDITRSSLRAM